MEAQQRLYPRLQQLARIEQEKQRTQRAAQEIAEALQHAEHSRQPLRLPLLSGTAFEGIFTKLNGKYLTMLPPAEVRDEQ
ncbi:hypothetical protein EPA93_33505 [Ktedonosporobacter rubrisoli]|uniref:Uncharacterized protein n=1 Tax=Ktedonosporobacter rubrisoli TaxID=2509675 RepID=A0A4P6JXX1_KTERU|nr:hypothetical protein [Ktedonosporobacter rubrisoli]QBD80628.1 hypothetical protein EPA93_33505 [Ktedonosporobacter rubrisoli]